MRQSRVNRRTVKRQNRQRNRKQRGGKIVLPMEYFGGDNKHYSTNQTVGPEQFASSHGVVMPGKQMVGPDLRIAQPNKQQGGGVLPAEYFGGNSGRYYEEGSPELANCESAYGTIFASSHGVVMPGNNSQWMGPNLASFPNATKLQTGGKRRSRRTRKSKRVSKRGGGSCGSGMKGIKKATKKILKKPKVGGYRKKSKSAKKTKGKRGKKGKHGCGCRVTCKKC